MLDELAREVDGLRGSREEVQVWMREKYPDLPAKFLPRRNPSEPVRIEIAHAGGGQYLALALDERDADVEAIWGTKAEVLSAVQSRWPDLPVVQVPFVREENPGGRPACGGRWRKETVTDRALRYRAAAPECRPPGPPDRKSTRLNSSHIQKSRMPSSA